MPTPEILVPRDQEVLLAQYVEHWQAYRQAPLVSQDSDANALASLKVAEIQIAKLDVKPLADDKSQ